MFARGTLFAIVIFLAYAGQKIYAEDFLALRGGPAEPVQVNTFRPAPPLKQADTSSLFGPVRYMPWKNNCARIPPVIAGRPLDLPDPTYAQVAPYLLKRH